MKNFLKNLLLYAAVFAWIGWMVCAGLEELSRDDYPPPPTMVRK